MAANVSGSKETMLHILKHYISGLKDAKEFRCLTGLTDFKSIVSKSKKSSYSFDQLSQDIETLVKSAEEGKYRKIFVV